MKTKLLLVIGVILVAATVISFSSCTGVKATGSSASVNESGVSASVSSDELQFENAKLPEGWPSDVPVYPDLAISSSKKSKTSDGKDMYSIQGTSANGTVKDVYNWYKDKMSGYQVNLDDLKSTTGYGDAAVLAFKSDKYKINANINSLDKKTAILMLAVTVQ